LGKSKIKNMQNKKIYIQTALAGAGAALLLVISIAVANAQTASGTATSTRLRPRYGIPAPRRTNTASTSTIATRSDQEITQRIGSLNSLLTRIGEMQKVSSSSKDQLSATIQAQVTDLTNLKTQIANDSNSTSSLRTDFQSITKSYRIYALVVPQGTITAAADRVMTIASTTDTLAGILQTRISEAQTTGNDVSALQASLSDMNAKTTDANAQAQAALNEISPLAPDNGSSTQMKANTATLKDARAKIATAQKDLIAARKDAGTIVKALIAMDKPATASSTPQ
jgi:chromosome segregation ATPase